MSQSIDNTLKKGSTLSPSSQSHVLGLNGINNALWLVKIPKFVAESWSSANDGEILGSLSSSAVKDSSTNQIIKKLNVTLSSSNDSMNTTDPGIEEKALQFTLDELGTNLTKSNDLLAFVHDQSSNKYSLVGRCTKSLTLKPKDNQQYHNLRRQRLLAESTRKQSGYLDPKSMSNRPISSSSYIMNVSTSTSDSSNGNGPSKKSKVDVDSNLIRSRIFMAFTKEEKILLNDLLAQCKDIPGVSAETVRPILEMYAVFHKKGQFHSYWELKPEYRDQSSK